MGFRGIRRIKEDNNRLQNLNNTIVHGTYACKGFSLKHFTTESVVGIDYRNRIE